MKTKRTYYEEWGMWLTAREAAAKSRAWLRQVELGNQGWIEWSKTAPIEWAQEEGLPLMVQAAMKEVFEQCPEQIDWV